MSLITRYALPYLVSSEQHHDGLVLLAVRQLLLHLLVLKALHVRLHVYQLSWP